MSCSCGRLSLVTSSPPMSPDGQHPPGLHAVPGGVITVMLGWVSHGPRLLCPVVPALCLHDWGWEPLCHRTGHSRSGPPLLPWGVCSANLVEGLQMFLAT